CRIVDTSSFLVCIFTVLALICITYSCHPRSTLFPYTTLFRSERKGYINLHSDRSRGIQVLVGIDEDSYELPVIGQVAAGSPIERSEEHTSELQSRFDLVCRLLLEKKKYIYTRRRIP